MTNSIAAAIRAEMGPGNRSVCRTCTFINSRPEAEAKEWREALKDLSLTSSAASRVLTRALDGKFSFDSIGPQAVSNHRKAGHK